MPRSAPTEANNVIPRHLFIAPRSVPEAIMMQPAIALHQRAFPDVSLDVIANESVAPFLEAIPQVVDVIVVPDQASSGLRTTWKLAEVLRDRHYGRCYNLQKNGSTAMAPWMARIPERRHLGRHGKSGLTDRIEQFVRLVCDPDRATPGTIPVPRLTASGEAAHFVKRELEKHFDAGSKAPLIVLCPGASSPTRQWPARHFANLAAMLTRQWPGTRIVMVGTRLDRNLCTEIATLSTVAMVNLAGQLSTIQTIALLQASKVAVCNDSDLLHVAAASAGRLVAVYGATSPTINPPLTIDAQVHWLNLTCSPCNANSCALGHANCVNLLDPVRVFNSIERVIKATDTSH
ncbi:MAG: lipopolysaccharide heptosyltransferase II [Burkholderiaceae bacterium]